MPNYIVFGFVDRPVDERGIFCILLNSQLSSGRSYQQTIIYSVHLLYVRGKALDTYLL
jgi:hypothetical protein